MFQSLAALGKNKNRNDDRITMHPIGVKRKPAARIRKWNQFSQFRWTSTKLILIEKEFSSQVNLRAKSSRKAASKESTILHTSFSYLSLLSNIQVSTGSTRPDKKTVFHTKLYGRSKETKSNSRRKKLHRTN